MVANVAKGLINRGVCPEQESAKISILLSDPAKRMEQLGMVCVPINVTSTRSARIFSLVHQFPQCLKLNKYLWNN